MADSRHFIVALVEEFTHLAFSCAVEPLWIANLVSEQNLYRQSFGSESGTRAIALNGSFTQVQHTFQALPASDQRLQSPLSPPEIAAMLGISTRQLERLFVRDLTTSPKKHFTEMRLESARANEGLSRIDHPHRVYIDRDA